MPSVHRRVYWLGLAPTYSTISRFFGVFFFVLVPGKGGTRLRLNDMSILFFLFLNKKEDASGKDLC